MCYIEDPIIRDFPTNEKYQISENGEIYCKTTGNERKQTIRKKKYKRISIKCGKNRRTYDVHRLLAILFIPNINNYKIVDHIDRNTLNNNLCNLRWVNESMNRTNVNIPKTNTSGLKNISTDIKGNHIYYKVKVIKNGKNYSKCFFYDESGLTKAIIWRDQTIAKYHTYD